MSSEAFSGESEPYSLTRSYGKAATWVSHAHLSRAGQKATRARFLNSPHGVVVIDDFLHFEVAEILSRYLRHIAHYTEVRAITDGTNDPLAAGEKVPPAVWDATPERRRLFVFECGDVPSQYTDEAVAFLDFSAFARSTEFRLLLEAFTGFRLGPVLVESHRMRTGSFVGPHTDDRANRRLGLVHYLSDESQTAGGLLVFERPGAPHVTIEPKYNRMVVFDVAAHRCHQVTRVRRGERLSINGWCLSRSRQHDTADRRTRMGSQD